MEKKLFLEKTNEIDGRIVYRVWHGIELLIREEEAGDNAIKDSAGKSVAYNVAKAVYDNAKARIGQGYPKTETIESHTYEG